jgi:hypothetical protein
VTSDTCIPVGSSGGNSISCSQLLHKQNVIKPDIPQDIAQSMIAIKYKRIISLLYLDNINMNPNNVLQSAWLIDFQDKIRTGRGPGEGDEKKKTKPVKSTIMTEDLRKRLEKLKLRTSPITTPPSLQRQTSFSPLTIQSTQSSNEEIKPTSSFGGKKRRKTRKKKKRKTRRRRKTKKRKTKRRKTRKRR